MTIVLRTKANNQIMFETNPDLGNNTIYSKELLEGGTAQLQTEGNYHSKVKSPFMRSLDLSNETRNGFSLTGRNRQG